MACLLGPRQFEEPQFKVRQSFRAPSRSLPCSSPSPTGRLRQTGPASEEGFLSSHLQARRKSRGKSKGSDNRNNPSNAPKSCHPGPRANAPPGPMGRLPQRGGELCARPRARKGRIARLGRSRPSRALPVRQVAQTEPLLGKGEQGTPSAGEGKPADLLHCLGAHPRRGVLLAARVGTHKGIPNQQIAKCGCGPNCRFAGRTPPKPGCNCWFPRC